jgi:hypothetical protein
MSLWRLSYHLLHDLDTRVRMEFEHGRFSYPKGSLPPYQREGIEGALLNAKVPRALIALKKSGLVVIYGAVDAGVAQRIRNIVNS